MPRTPVGTSTQTKDQKDNGQKEVPSNLPPKDFAGPSKSVVEDKKDEIVDDVLQVKENEEVIQDEIRDVVEEESSITEPVSIATITRWIENGRVSPLDLESKEAKGVPKRDADGGVGRRPLSENVQLDAVPEAKDKQKESTEISSSQGPTISRRETVVAVGTSSERKPTDVVTSDEVKKRDKESLIIRKSNKASQIQSTEVKHISEDQSMDSVLVEKNDLIVEVSEEENKLRLEMEENLRKQAVERLAGENFLRGNKLFCYPEVVNPDQHMEVFLNKSLSTLSNEPDVIIMGAFNDWKWKSFRIKLDKTHLGGEWWSCRVHVPREAYKMDFVFFNGKDVYDNNNDKDFSITVEGGMGVLEFEEFLLEEKRKELENLAKEQAERERLAEEQRRIEAEKAASEADRAQAKEEAAKRREMLNKLIKKAVKSVDNVWYIEPSKFKGEDKVRLFYNRRSGPLIHANDVWLHGGHNNWRDGLSVVAKLEKAYRKDEDWWYAEGK